MVLSAALVILDSRTSWLQPVRSALGTVAAPFYLVVDVPVRISDWFGDRVSSRQALMDRNRQLELEILSLRQQVQKMAMLKAENIRLRNLLNSSALLESEVLVSEIIGTDPDPYRHEIIINKGASDGVYVGQPVLDAQGLMGQVIEVNRWQSRALLITDASHAVSVEVNRNGIRAVAAGSGRLDLLHLLYVPDTADIQEGDLLVSSGLGDRFPRGYPVARVISVTHDPGQPFALIEARPTARTDRTRHVLLVFDKNIQQALLDMEAAGHEEGEGQ